MHSSHGRLPYCLSVGIVLVNHDGLIWIGQRQPECTRVDAPGRWQMPQDRIAPSESVREAGLRILAQETGVTHVQVLAEAPGWFACELPAHLMGAALDGRYCGHKQRWLAMRFLGEERDITESAHGRPRPWRWALAADVPGLGSSLKREICEDVLATFAPFVRSSGEATAAQDRERRGPAAVPWFVALPR